MTTHIETRIDVSLTERNRLTALFRIILALPIAIFVASFTPPSDMSSSDSGFFALGFLVLPVGLALVFRQVYPTYLLTFNQALLALQTRVHAYLLLLTDEYPSIEENTVVSVTFPPVDAKALNRWLPLVKWFLAIPLYVVGIIYVIYAAFLSIFAWFSVVFSGKYPEWCAEGVVGTIAYWNRVAGYCLLFVTDEYPSFSL